MKSVALKTKFSAQTKPFTDVVGLELGAGYSQGVPAVRLRKKEGRTELLAFDFLSLPDKLPLRPDEADELKVWSLPRPFQAPHAALAITSPLSFLRHSSGIYNEAEDEESLQFSYRTLSRALAPEVPPILAGIPDFQAAWAARLFPESHYPTACSLQVSAAAAINTFLAAPLLDSLSGTAAVLFVFSGHTSLAAFKDSRLVLYREHPIGYGHLREAISSQMRIEPSLADSVLEDTFVDPTPMIEPVLRTLFRQVEISHDYLSRRRNCETNNFFVCGLPSGFKYWAAEFSRMLNFTLTHFLPFDYVEKTTRPDKDTKNFASLPTVAPFLITALGAARAVLEDV